MIWTKLDDGTEGKCARFRVFGEPCEVRLRHEHDEYTLCLLIGEENELCVEFGSGLADNMMDAIDEAEEIIKTALLASIDDINEGSQ